MPKDATKKKSKSKGPVDIFAVATKSKTTKKVKKTEKKEEKPKEVVSGDEKPVNVSHNEEWNDELHEEPVRQVQAKLKTSLQLQAISKQTAQEEEDSGEEDAKGDWAKKDGISGADEKGNSDIPNGDMFANDEPAKPTTPSASGKFVPIHLRSGGGGAGRAGETSFLNAGLRGPGGHHGLVRRNVAPPKLDDASAFPSLAAAKKDNETKMEPGFNRVQNEPVRGYGGSRQAAVGALSTANKFGRLEF